AADIAGDAHGGSALLQVVGVELRAGRVVEARGQSVAGGVDRALDLDAAAVVPQRDRRRAFALRRDGAGDDDIATHVTGVDADRTVADGHDGAGDRDVAGDPGVGP